MNAAVLGFGVVLGVASLLLETLFGIWGPAFARGQALLELLTFPAFLLVVVGLAMERRPGRTVDFPSAWIPGR
ncbi:MAG TPA: hypothetical protein VGV89_04935 [Thermoplasmata archaeon]|nr:hypothetical protein [Thermoplasmata archaeon]